MEERDVLVVGGGPAGYAAAIRAAQLGGRVTIVEKEALGGTCLNRGCIPTRVFTRAAEFVDVGSHSKDYGIIFKDESIDFAKLAARKDVVVKTLVAGVRMLLKENGVEVAEGTATLLKGREVSVAAPDGTTKAVSAESVIVATGARCKEPSVSGGKIVLNTTDALQLKEIPRSMAILGAGYIGMSLATVFSRLGATVAILEESASMLKGIDEEIVALYEKEAKKSKIQYYPECLIQGFEQVPDGVRTRAKTKGQEVIIDAQYVVNAEGREANIEGLGLEDLGLGLNQKKGVSVDGAMRTNLPGVFAAGDVTLEHMWTDVAYMEGVVAAENAMGREARMDYSVVPLWTSAVPNIAGVGLTEDAAIKKGYDVKVARFFLAASGMATVLGQRVGMLKLITERKYGRILGVHIVGAQAMELIAEASLAVKQELTFEDIGAVLHAHPSLSEALWEAARSIGGDSIHLMPQK